VLNCSTAYRLACRIALDQRIDPEAQRALKRLWIVYDDVNAPEP
jgi:hypothetical protein